MDRILARYYKGIISRGGGIITCRDHLGVFVAKAENAKRCPPGWVFVDVDAATIEIIEEAVDCVKAGRKEWPGGGWK